MRQGVSSLNLATRLNRQITDQLTVHLPRMGSNGHARPPRLVGSSTRSKLFTTCRATKAVLSWKADPPVERVPSGAVKTRVPAVRGLHDVEQNLRLLAPLGIEADEKPERPSTRRTRPSLANSATATPRR